MKIILMILLSAFLSFGNSEYPRFKRKGLQQNGPPRPPPPPQFGKKWGKPPQKMPPQFVQNRPYQGPPPPPRGNRPPKPQMHKIQGFNIHMAQMQHPMFGALKYQQFPQLQKKQPPTMKEFFKNPTQQYHKIKNIQAVSGQIIQFPQENKVTPKIIHKQEKPSFISSPSIPTAVEYDYHIQTNSIPMSANTIKQVGEKGPIHTIPAPNLTPADMPSNLELRKPQQYHQQQEVRFQHPQYLNQQSQIHNQYQVTERNEQAPKLFRDQINSQTHYNPSQVSHLVGQQLDQYGNQHADLQNNAQGYQNAQSVFYGQNNPGVTMQETGNHGINIGFGQPQADESGQEDMLFSNSKNYQVVNAHFSTGQSNQNLHTQAIQSSYEQQQPQILTQFAQPSESGYVQQYHQENDQADEDKNLNVEPEYHSFNYDEQARQAQAKSDQSAGFVTGTYSLGPSDEVVKGQNINSRSSSVDPLTQAQIVQSYFKTRSANDVVPDAKPSGSGNDEKAVQNTSYYSSLPSKEAADRLAKLQAAGKVNSNLMQIENKNQSQKDKENEMSTIYVPDDHIADEREDPDSKGQSVEYDDYPQEDETSQSDEESGFGQKTKF